MTIRQQIADQIDQLPPARQEEVLRFLTSLRSQPVGESGTAMVQLSHTLDAVSAQQMRETIQQECEQVDPSQW